MTYLLDGLAERVGDATDMVHGSFFSSLSSLRFDTAVLKAPRISPIGRILLFGNNPNLSSKWALLHKRLNDVFPLTPDGLILQAQ